MRRQPLLDADGRLIPVFVPFDPATTSLEHLGTGSPCAAPR